MAGVVVVVVGAVAVVVVVEVAVGAAVVVEVVVAVVGAVGVVVGVEVLVNTPEGAAALCRRIRSGRPVGFDTESTGPRLLGKNMLNVHASTLVGLSVAVDDFQCYVPIAHKQGQNLAPGLVLELLKELSKASVWVFNLKHDLHALHRFLGTDYAPDSFRCALVAAWMGNEEGARSLKLKDLEVSRLRMEPRPDFQATSKGRGWDELSPEEAAGYAAQDAASALAVGELYKARLESWALWDHFLAVEMPFLRVLVGMERRGVRLDEPRLLALESELQAKVYELKADWDFLFPQVSISSPDQVRGYFFAEGLWPIRGVEVTKTGKLSAGADAMEIALAHPRTPRLGRRAAEIRLEWSFLNKNLSTYTSKLVGRARSNPDGLLHPDYLQTGTAPGRLSCTDPNLQNIPSHSDLAPRILECFLPRRPGDLFAGADYSQLQLRVLAHYAKGGRLVEAYRTAADVHAQTAELAGCSRTAAKTTMFARIFGGGAFRVSKVLGCSLAEGRRIVNAISRTTPEIDSVRNKMIAFAVEYGYVPTLTGRRRYLKDILSDDRKVRASAERKAFNTPIQGTEADIAKAAMLRVEAALPGSLALQIHDDLVVALPEEEAQEGARALQEAMEGAWPSLRVPLVAEPRTGRTWKDVKG